MAPPAAEDDATGAAGGEAPGSLAEAWRETGLRFEQAAEALTAEACEGGDERGFLACVHGLDAAVRAARPGVRLAPATSSAAVQQFGAISIVTTHDDEPESDVALRDTLAAWRALFARAAPRVDWAAAVRWLRDGLSPDDEARVTAAAMNGALRTALDPFHRLVPTAWEERRREAHGVATEGVGLVAERRGEEHVVVRVFPGGPAAGAGVVAGDVVTTVDGEAVRDWTSDALAARLEGPPGTEIALGLRGRDEVTRVVTLVRARVEVPFVSWGVLTLGEGDDAVTVGYLGVRSLFSESLCADLDAALATLAAEGPAALVLDLRGDVGGLVTAATCAAGAFLPAGTLVARLVPATPADGDAPVDATTTGPPRSGLPLVVMVDGDTGSAAEIVAGALQEAARAVVVGTRTYGKGTVQLPAAFGGARGVTFYRTAGRYRLASGRELHLVGVVPDVDVAPEVTDVGVARAYLEALRDPRDELAGAPPRTRPPLPEARTRCAARLAAASVQARGPAGPEAPSAPVVRAAALAACCVDAAR